MVLAGANASIGSMPDAGAPQAELLDVALLGLRDELEEGATLGVGDQGIPDRAWWCSVSRLPLEERALLACRVEGSFYPSRWRISACTSGGSERRYSSGNRRRSSTGSASARCSRSRTGQAVVASS